MTDPVNELRTVGRDLSDTGRLSPTFNSPKTRVPPTVARSALLLVNSPTGYRLNLGTTPVNDAVAFGELLKESGFDVYFLVRPQAAATLKVLDALFSNTTTQFVLFYSGHGHGVLEELDEVFNPEQAFVFTDGVIREDEFVQHLVQHKNPTKEIILIADACIAGTIWDLQSENAKDKQLPPGVVAISTVGDPLAIKPVAERQKNGVFTNTLVQLVKGSPEITLNELAAKMKPVIRGIGRNFVIGTTSPSLLKQPIFEY
jgi:hypothetical protein